MNNKMMYYLPYTVFRCLYDDAQEITDIEMYIAERGWQEWMDCYDTDTIVQTLQTVHDLARKGFRELRKETGLSQVRMALAYGFKTRTLENWEAGERIPPEHDRLLLSYVIFLKLMNQEGQDGNFENQD